MSWEPYDLDDHLSDYIVEQSAIEAEYERYAQLQELQAQQERNIRILRECAELDIGYALCDFKKYINNLTPQGCSELEALLVRLNIIIPENDSRGIADLGKEYVSKTANFENTPVDESAERDLEKYLSKLTSEKREELEDILNRFKEASAKLDELQQIVESQKSNQLTTAQALICVGLIALIIIFYAIVCYLD